MRSYKPTHLFSDDPKRCIRRTTTDYRPYRSSHAECHLVAVEVVGLLAVFSVFGWPISNLCLRLVGIRVGIDIGISAVRVDFLQQMADVSNESSFLFEVVWSFSVFQTTFAYPSAQGIVGVHQSFFRTVFLEDFGFNQFVEARFNLQLAYY